MAAGAKRFKQLKNAMKSMQCRRVAGDPATNAAELQGIEARGVGWALMASTSAVASS